MGISAATLSSDKSGPRSPDLASRERQLASPPSTVGDAFRCRQWPKRPKSNFVRRHGLHCVRRLDCLTPILSCNPNPPRSAAATRRVSKENAVTLDSTKFAPAYFRALKQDSLVVGVAPTTWGKSTRGGISPDRWVSRTPSDELTFREVIVPLDGSPYAEHATPVGNSDRLFGGRSSAARACSRADAAGVSRTTAEALSRI